MGTLLRVLFYVVLFMIVGIMAIVALACYFTPLEPQDLARHAYHSIREVVGLGGQGRAVGGPAPPTLAERLAAQSARHVITPAQEVVMVGGDGPCLGGDNERLVEVKNDIGAEQLDLSYAVEGNAQLIDIASCGKESFIRHCVPLAADGVRLFLRVYQNEDVAGQTISVVSTRKYETLLSATKPQEVNLLASSFVPVEA